MNISIIETRTIPTIQIEMKEKSIFLHSKYDPVREINAWCKNALEGIKNYPEIVIIGLAAGYHIEELAGHMPDKQITVLEFNDQYYNWFINSPFYKKVAGIKNVAISSFSNLSHAEQQELLYSIPSSNLLIHKSGLDLLPHTHEKIKEILEDIQFHKNSIKNQIDNMNRNFQKNIALKDKGIGKLKDMYDGKPMILISAGPSLDKQMPLLKRIYNEDKIILGAVGTAIKPLLKNNIIPHFFSIIDPNPATYSQLTNTHLPKSTLFYLSTAYHETILLHDGPRHILWQKGFEEAEWMAKKSDDPLIHTGGSVATALLDLMIRLGAGPLALVGQDLAYTDGFSHANHSHAQRSVKVDLGNYKTMNYYRSEEIKTSRNLTIYRKWFENYTSIH